MENKKLVNTHTALMLTLIVVLATVVSGCSSAIETGEASGEESGTALALDETYDVVRNGARLVMTYDAQSNAFKGTVENTTGGTLTQVRVEVPDCLTIT